jgi:ribonuclease E
VDADGAPRLPMTALLFQAPEVAAQQAHRGAAELAAEALEEEMVRAEAKKVRGAAKKKGSKAATQASGKKDTAQASGATPPATSPAEEQPSEPTATESQDDAQGKPRRRGGRGKGGKGAKSRADEAPQEQEVTASSVVEDDDESSGSRRRRRRRRSERGAEAPADEVTGLTGSTRLEAKRQRRREGRDAGRRRPVITESEFLARREAVDRLMVVRELDGRTQIAVLEDGILVEHYLSRHSQSTIVGDVYLGRVHNVLPSMEAAFVDIGKTRNAVLYAGEVNWDAAGMSGQPRRIEDALKAGDSVLVQVTKDPIGHKGARLTSQITLAGRHMVLVPSGGMTGISRKLPDHERTRLKKQLKKIVPDGAGVIVRTAAEGASEAELTADMARLTERWAQIQNKTAKAHAPALLKGEPDIAIRVIRDVFNEDFASLVVQGQSVWHQISSYIGEVAPDLAQRMELWTGTADVFAQYRIDEQLMKALDRKVWLPSGGSLIIDRTEAMTVIDVNTGKFTGSGGTLEETVTRNNLEAAEEIVRQLRLRDIGGIIVIDFIDMVLESNRDLVLRRLIECLGRDRTRHQVAEVTSLGLVQMTRKRVGQGLVEAFSEVCENCHGRGYLVTADAEGVPEPKRSGGAASSASTPAAQPERKAKRTRGGKKKAKEPAPVPIVGAPPEVKATLASIAAAATHRHQAPDEGDLPLQDSPSDGATPGQAAEPPDGGSGEQDKTEPPAQPAKKASKTAKPAKASKTAKAAPKSKSAPPAEQATPAPAAAPAADPAAEAPRPKRTRRKATAPAGPPPSL